jgi:ADP-heptose:LPS heptosyltransferase
VNEHDPIIPISPRDREFVDTIVPPDRSAPCGPRIVIHPGSSPSTSYKRWEWGRFAQLADILIQKYGGKIFFTAGTDETELVERIVEAMKGSQYVLCQTETLTQLAELMRRCDLYIGNDTAPMHLSSFMGTPVVALFGPTDPVENSPYGKATSLVLRKDVPCSPCRKRECDNLICMDAIAVEDVLEAAEQILAEKGYAQTQSAALSHEIPV